MAAKPRKLTPILQPFGKDTKKAWIFSVRTGKKPEDRDAPYVSLNDEDARAVMNKHVAAHPQKHFSVFTRDKDGDPLDLLAQPR